MHSFLSERVLPLMEPFTYLSLSSSMMCPSAHSPLWSDGSIAILVHVAPIYSDVLPLWLIYVSFV